ncbi:type IV pilin protein [Demequina sp. SO4-18]|uniref:type IV pilin protein n=1 Tax=Demequina sp. SO4-18 TaxID=3401026 RepID=UPI003B5CFBE5
MTVPTSRRGSEAGFSLPELLVVILIVALLAAIAIPLYLDHSRKANDAAAQSDAMNLGTLVRAAFDEGGEPTVTMDGDRRYTIDGEVAFGASPGVEFVTFTEGDLESWCVQLRHPDGDKAASPGVRFDAQHGYVEQAACP